MKNRVLLQMSYMEKKMTDCLIHENLGFNKHETSM